MEIARARPAQEGEHRAGPAFVTAILVEKYPSKHDSCLDKDAPTL
jgi:hypothetical protein